MNLLYIHNRHAQLLNLSTLALTEFLSLSPRSTPLADGRIQTVFFSSKNFLALMEQDSRSTIAAWGSVEGGEVELMQIGDLNVQRRNSGVVLWDRSVFVFGGLRETERIEILADAEVLDISNFPKATPWAIFPSMFTPRCCFTPCTYNDEIFLCGGFTNRCEKLTPRTQSYTKLWLSLPEYDGHAHCTFVVENTLVVLSRHWVLRWPCDGDEYESDEIDEINDTAAIAGPVVRGNKGIFAVSGAIVKFNIKKMRACWHEM